MQIHTRTVIYPGMVACLDFWAENGERKNWAVCKSNQIIGLAGGLFGTLPRQ
jgi:hypothetical protein